MRKRYGQCDDTCTTDCGHCKGDHEAAAAYYAATAARDLTARLEPTLRPLGPCRLMRPRCLSTTRCSSTLVQLCGPR
jgi:hypothetical protein